MRAALGIAIAGLLSLSVALGGDSKSDLEKLQGKWAAEADGKKLEMTFNKNSFALTISGDNKELIVKGVIKVDSSKNPKHMDLSIQEGGKHVGKTAEAIFALEGDNLNWCATEPGEGNRPTEFPKEQGTTNGRLFLIFKRAK